MTLSRQPTRASGSVDSNTMPSRALLTEPQSLTWDQLTQMLGNVGIARASLGTNADRVNDDTLTNEGLTNLTVDLEPDSRYRLVYRIYASGSPGFKIGFVYPVSLPQFDGQLFAQDIIGGFQPNIYANWPDNFNPSGEPVIDAIPDFGQSGGFQFTADITTGSGGAACGLFQVVFGQSDANAETSTISKNSSVEVLKFQP